MSTWKRFWMATLSWSAALLAVQIAYSLVVHFSTDIYHGPGAIVLALHATLRTVGLFFPLIAFVAALKAGSAPPARGRVLNTASVAAPIAAGAAAYLWLAYIEPWSRVAIFRWTAELADVAIEPAPVASTQRWLANQLSNPAIGPADERVMGWLFHLPNAMGLLTALFGIAGLVVARRAVTTPQRWSMAALVSLLVAPMLLGSLRLSTRYDVPPEPTVYGMLLVPLFLLAILAWTEWTERERAPVAATA